MEVNIPYIMNCFTENTFIDAAQNNKALKEENMRRKKK